VALRSLIICGLLTWALALAPVRPVAASGSEADTFVRIGILGLFQPTELRVSANPGTALVFTIGGRSKSLSGSSALTVIHASDGHILISSQGWSDGLQGSRLEARVLRGSPRFWLEVPGKLRREYAGALEIRPRGQVLEAVVTMPLETAVASIVQAESPPDAGLEALKAQAVAARSFLLARQTSHVGFDFCDTTHCQFLRSPAAEGSPASEAANATRGLVLTWHDEAAAKDRTLAAMYARSCGGRTRSLKEIGGAIDGRRSHYPYYAVRCSYCTRHPEQWRREAVTMQPHSERERLAFNRIHGWSALPSMPVVDPGDSPDGPLGSIAGRGIGHGVGLCQLGAAEMARSGSDFRQILAHYYPNTRLTDALVQ